MPFIPFTPSPKNPTSLTPRFEIRQLTPAHSAWASAIVCHSNILHSPVWSLAYPTSQTARLHAMHAQASYIVDHQIASGLSFGVFDTTYTFRRPSSAATDGALYFDPSLGELSSAELLEQMDFPLVSVAMAYDGFDALDMSRLLPMIAVLPLFGTVYHKLEELDPRPAHTWKVQNPREVLMRNATSTRADYEGHGLMKGLAHWLMRHAAAEGFWGAQIECAHDAVDHVWTNPPTPFTAARIATWDTATYSETDAEGKTIKPFGACKQVVTKVFVTLDHKTAERMAAREAPAVVEDMPAVAV